MRSSAIGLAVGAHYGILLVTGRYTTIMGAITLLLLVLQQMLYTGMVTADARPSHGRPGGYATWSTEYIEAVLDARLCMNQSHTAVLDRLFEKMHDMELTKLYYARGLNFFGTRVQRGVDTCTAMLETASYVYRDMLYGRQETINWQFHENERAIREAAAANVIKSGGTVIQSEVAAQQAMRHVARATKEIVKDESRDPTIEHISRLLTENALRPQCDAVGQSPPQLVEMKLCLREKRKDAIKIKINFNAPRPDADSQAA